MKLVKFGYNLRNVDKVGEYCDFDQRKTSLLGRNFMESAIDMCLLISESESILPGDS